MIWNEKIECAGRDEMKAIQSKRLIETVQRIYHNVPTYRAKMQAADLVPGDIKSIDDLHKLPFTTKADLRDNYPFGMFTVPMSEIVRVHASSGTTGKPTVVGYTRKDLQSWSEVVTRSLCMAGVCQHDIVQVAYGYGLFTGGLGLHYGCENLGATVIPISGGNTAKQLQLMEDFGTSVIACTPSYALYLSEAIAEAGIKKENLKLRVGIFGAEPWTENMRREIELKLGLKAIDIYGLSEIIGPGVSCECEYQCGMHINEDHFVPEIIDPETLQPLPAGERGELVFTTITKEGIPLIRYRTRDLTRLIYDKCECGRTTVRMEKCTGRSDDMLIIRGVNVFPSQIESVLLEMSETAPHYLITVEREDNLDILNVMVEVQEQFFSDEIRQLEALRKKITQKIHNTLGISVNVKLVEPKTIERTAGKAKRVIDNRKL
ncbi:MAG: phenylacetate--CoA ligase [Bacteroidetes bacterium GWF2_42_66]|nr:MAG: phenylacetate--CoA ligase [Bacteroidetes bacterium GWA2_42_15]OFY01520.1 MAG: phenylacetate--CoA ligase [Bacteroidetes bacterium GWE2_42_39]OFY43299.1 MAG: phenylacetate--CoA ligase [Bacteroidetes bacterium GWF2_42_66]HBL77518.1 phenylacetate--CoA ligase [Prolixibacteraceae bacterium]HCR90681.1 phenylacetate--CoA ligase [Prolixibacteraceae bacterium]